VNTSRKSSTNWNCSYPAAKSSTNKRKRALSVYLSSCKHRKMSWLAKKRASSFPTPNATLLNNNYVNKLLNPKNSKGRKTKNETTSSCR